MAKAKAIKNQKENKSKFMDITFIKAPKYITRSRIIVIAVLVIAAVLLYHFKGIFVAATVNGQPISRIEILQQLEKEGGKSVLDTIVTNNLVLQEAQKEKVTASSTEVAAQIAQITTNLKAQGQDLNSALAAQGMSQNDLNYQVKLQLLVQKMAGKDITVSDKEAEDYFNQNKSTYPKGAKFADVSSQIKSDLTQQKLSSAITSWIANLKSKAKINYFVSY